VSAAGRALGERLRSRAATIAVASGLALLAIALLVPGAALAHGIVGKTDLPIPRWLFAWAAAVVLVISFVALATLWPKPRLEAITERELFHVPRVLEPICGAIGIAIFGVVVYAGLEGAPEATANLAPTFIYVIFWVGLAFASLLFGDLFRVFNPWRAFARAVAWIATRVSGRQMPAPMAYPPWLGRWPAAIGIFGFAWLELVYVNKTDPTRLAILSLVYAAIQLVGMSMFGIETWGERGDAFGVYFGLFARLSPLHWTEGRVRLRPPAVGAVRLDVIPGTVALLVVMIGSTSFDGFSVGSVWISAEPHVQSWFANLGFGPEAAAETANTLGLLMMITIVGSVFQLGIRGMRTVSGNYDVRELSARFAHSLLPISLAYVIAHYFSLLAYQGQAMAYLISDPLGQGSNLFGTANSQIDYNAVASNTIWYVQVGALVIGHAAGLMLAHDRALVMYKRASQATRSQYWMLAVMVGFTSLGLWILSSTQ
jgi:hypothetical protein